MVKFPKNFFQVSKSVQHKNKDSQEISQFTKVGIPQKMLKIINEGVQFHKNVNICKNRKF